MKRKIFSAAISPFPWILCGILVLFSNPGLRAQEDRYTFDPNAPNVFSWAPREAKFLRLTLERDQNAPCIDELEVFEADSDRNIALASLGVRATASSCIPDNAQHKIEHINDGEFGNARSWIPASRKAWIQLEFPTPVKIQRASVSRDRKEKTFRDRTPDRGEFLVSQDGREWTSVAKFARKNWLSHNNNDRPVNTPQSVRRAVLEMIDRFGNRYPDGEKTLLQLDQFEKRFREIPEDSPSYGELLREFQAFQRRALLANPDLDFDRILVIRGNRMAAPNNNFLTLEAVARDGFDNELALLSDLRSENPVLSTIYRPKNGRPLGEPELHWEGDRVMFSSISEEYGRWAVFEIALDGSGLKILSPTDQKDVDFFDSCYVPDGTIVAASTAPMQGLPCLNGGATMINLYKIDPETKKVRQLTYEQDSDWHPTLMRDGRIMYMRWEYTDMMHYFSRILFSMNPDGTNQRELYGSGSLFPTTLKHAREIPDSSELILVLSGHHGRGDTGRLAIIDPNLGRKYPFVYRPKTKEWGVEGTQIDVRPEVLPASQTGFVQEIPGYGLDVVGNVLDNQADGLKYNYIFPYPISKNYFLVNCQIAGDDRTYGLYLVDRFDNMTLIKKIDRQGLFNPIPLFAREKPRLRTDQTDPESRSATVFITDIYAGTGMKGVPRGTVKSLRIFSYHFAYVQRGGHDVVGVHSGWDIKRILGEVPVEEDGSLMFQMPSNAPVSLQPLDEQGRAVQLMRSWTVAMPGENVSCNGCHESQLEVSPSKFTIASRKAPKPIRPFFGPERSVTFETEIYHPVVKKYCMDCHDGEKEGRPSFKDVRTAYENIHPFVRRPGPETDMDVLRPMEYHASTSELCQMLEKNHYNVVLDDEAKRRLYCWIDLNAPQLGKWDHPQQSERRMELESLYSNVVHDYESDFDSQLETVRNTIVVAAAGREEYQKSADPPELESRIRTLAESNVWPFDEKTAKAMQAGEPTKKIELAPGVAMNFVRIPAGTFVLGSLEGYPDESPRSVQRIDRPFWISATEVSNAQYGVFDPAHDSRYIEEHGKDHIVPGYIANHPDQPVSRVSWDEAMRFARWFSDRFEESADLPSEAEWEWAARAGSEKRFFFGTLDTDFSPYANLAGAERRQLQTGWINGSTIHRRNFYPLESVFPLRDDRFADQWFTVDYVARCEPNSWGLYDMIGNNSEWTKSSYRPYPYDKDDGRNDPSSRERKTARGGSWHDRPKATGSATRFPYEPWQKVHNVGFRILLR